MGKLHSTGGGPKQDEKAQSNGIILTFNFFWQSIPQNAFTFVISRWTYDVNTLFQYFYLTSHILLQWFPDEDALLCYGDAVAGANEGCFRGQVQLSTYQYLHYCGKWGMWQLHYNRHHCLCWALQNTGTLIKLSNDAWTFDINQNWYCCHLYFKLYFDVFNSIFCTIIKLSINLFTGKSLP